MRQFLTLLFGFLFIVTDCPHAQQSEARDSSRMAFHSGNLHPNAPSETAMFGQLAGIWDAYQVKRNRDGTWSRDTTHAEWRWYYILDGHAIQDDWISLKMNNDSTTTPQVVGTNIRIYNPEEKQWHLAWIDKTNRRLATFTAMHEDGRVIMTGHNAQGRLIRNTFSNMTAQAFDWRQEWTADEGKTWFAVAKIWCKRRK